MYKRGGVKQFFTIQDSVVVVVVRNPITLQLEHGQWHFLVYTFNWKQLYDID
jgi:hypothetical protein